MIFSDRCGIITLRHKSTTDVCFSQKTPLYGFQRFVSQQTELCAFACACFGCRTFYFYGKKAPVVKEKVIIKETSSKFNFLVFLLSLITVILLILAENAMITDSSHTETWLVLTIISAFATGLACWVTTGCTIVVTDKRISGRDAFGRRVDLPLDSVTSVATTSFFTNGISVSTASGKITFLYLARKDRIASKIRRLLIDRQNTQNTIT